MSPDQSARATRIVEQELTEDSPGFIGLVVLVETTWVLQRRYRASSDEIRETVNDLLGSRTIVVENRDAVARALSTCETKACGFADAVIAASAASAGCNKYVAGSNPARPGVRNAGSGQKLRLTRAPPG